ncbi:MAG: ATP-binding protein [Chloroflexota bacterium]|nr:ATP-binding protein [Chloroflexota bacterium]
MSQPAPSPRPAASISLTLSVFVGRRREMDQLEATLSESMAGQGRLIMLAGEPGIGKTRTAQELASLTETRGAKVLWGRGFLESPHASGASSLCLSRCRPTAGPSILRLSVVRLKDRHK